MSAASSWLASLALPLLAGEAVADAMREELSLRRSIEERRPEAVGHSEVVVDRSAGELDLQGPRPRVVAEGGNRRGVDLLSVHSEAQVVSGEHPEAQLY